MKILITICARQGSKGIPGKNIKLLNDLPLIYYSISLAKKLAKVLNAEIALSTDSLKAKEIAKNEGIISNYSRPLELATDSAGKIPVIKDLLLYEESRINKKYDYVIDLDITSPLRTINDIQAALNILKENEKSINIFSVNPAERSPYFNMVEKQENGYYHVVKKPTEPVLSRQTAPKVYSLNASFFIFKRSFFNLHFKNAYTDYSLIYEMPHVCFDLDEAIDFEFLEFLIMNKKIKFEFY